MTEMSPYGLARRSDYEPPWMGMLKTAAQPLVLEADRKIAVEEAFEAGRVQGEAATRSRVAGILNCIEATGRQAQARTVALTTDVSVEQARNLLKVTPLTVPASNLPSIEERAAGMEGVGPALTPMESLDSASDMWNRVIGKRRETSG